MLTTVVVGLIAYLAHAASFSGWTPRIPGEHAVSSLEKLELGGMDQWVLIRGQDDRNPVLLWLHGGPGSAQMPISRHFNGSLEASFVVVHWDQRGAGKSNPRGFDESTMSIEQFTADAHDLTRYLQQRFDHDRIYLLGHSWGTQIGIRVAERFPDDYAAYIAVGQVVNFTRANELGYAWLQQQVEEDGSRRALERLDDIGEPPYNEHGRYVSYARTIESYGGGTDIGFASLLWIALGSPEYTFSDYGRWLDGSTRGSGPMWDPQHPENLLAEPERHRIEVPVFFFCGRKDHNTPPELVEEFAQHLDAPRGASITYFENSAHTPFIAEPEAFERALLEVLQLVPDRTETDSNPMDADGSSALSLPLLGS
ncbi:alpha/beta hydrolase [Candidatus Bipolaricaulota bacterium]|nr:alpha/beta hydrolase [Candidatus Bipolaricaulota bacterium]